jgi:hypothetical protein
MTQRHAIIEQVMVLARVPGVRRRRAVERELRDHLEDLMEEARLQGHDEAMVQRLAAIRFGDPRQIAAAFASVYALARWRRRVVAGAILLLASVAAVSFAVGTVQSGAALLTGVPCAGPSGGFLREALGLAAIVLGYCGAYVAERLFPASFARAAGLGIGIALCLAASLLGAAPAHAGLPCVALAGAALARTLQRVPVPALWLAGTAGPLTMAWLLLPRQGPPVWLVWVGLTLSCAAMRRIVRLFEKRAFPEILA